MILQHSIFPSQSMLEHNVSWLVKHVMEDTLAAKAAPF